MDVSSLTLMSPSASEVREEIKSAVSKVLFIFINSQYMMSLSNLPINLSLSNKTQQPFQFPNRWFRIVSNLPIQLDTLCVAALPSFSACFLQHGACGDSKPLFWYITFLNQRADGKQMYAYVFFPPFSTKLRLFIRKC